MAQQCTRFIANAVVYYNSAILLELLRSLESASNAPAIDTLRRVTPLAWQLINFYGRYQFDGDLKSINLTEMAAEIAKSNSKRWAGGV